ncbi:hypothetical protein BDY24DRAFT_377832 [Mrakia frigida]|uniref:uncharacterized protein n=1 Tax=Mrakia frigida TaxID=29902 RepID=UPI003FCC11D2
MSKNAVASSSKHPSSSSSNSRPSSKPCSPSKPRQIVLCTTPIPREIDSDDDFNERVIPKEEKISPPKGRRKKSLDSTKPAAGGKINKRTSGVKKEESGDEEENGADFEKKLVKRRKKEVKVEVDETTDDSEVEKRNKGKGKAKGNGKGRGKQEDWEKQGAKNSESRPPSLPLPESSS